MQTRWARPVTEVLSPPHLVIAITAASGLVGGQGWQRLGWALLASLFTGIIPYVVALRAVARGTLSSRDLPERSERIRPMSWALASVLLGWVLMVLLDAPQQVLAVQAAMVSGALTVLAITVFWKISVHCGVAASTAICAAYLFGAWTLVIGVPLVLAVGWSRLVLRAHTPAQVVAGTLVGALSAWPLLLIGG